MALNLNQKKEVVAELADVASKAHSLVAAEYAGLTVQQLTDLRKKARQSGVFVKVAKNTLVSRAVEGTDYAVIQDELTGPLLYAFSASASRWRCCRHRQARPRAHRARSGRPTSRSPFASTGAAARRCGPASRRC